MYPVEVKICSKNGWHTPQEAKAYYGRYSRDGITVHWWGDNTGASNHDNIVNYFSKEASNAVKSVNYVVSDIKITKMVGPENVAWASQNGNPTTVSIEFQPTLTDEGYKRGGWLIADLEKRFGKPLRLYKHSEWFATSCPGTIDLARLRAIADTFKQEEEPVNEGDITNLYRDLLEREPDAAGFATYKNKPWKEAYYALSNSPERQNLLERKKLEVDSLQNTVDYLSQQVLELNSKVTGLSGLPAKIDELTSSLNEKSVIIRDLESKLASHSDDTVQLNALGAALQWLIKRLGLKG